MRFLYCRIRNESQASQRTAFLLEADRSTMTLERLRDKFTRYSHMYSDRVHQERLKIPNFRLLVVAKSADRAANLLQILINNETPAVPLEHRAFFLVANSAGATRNPAPSATPGDFDRQSQGGAMAGDRLLPSAGLSPRTLRGSKNRG
jgi:hypothetical protein